MSVSYSEYLTNQTWQCNHFNLTPNQKLILLSMALSAKLNKPISVSLGNIAKKTHLATQTIERNLRSLIKEGYITKVKDHTASTAAEYIFNDNVLIS